MTPRNFHLLMGLLFIMFAGVCSYQQESGYFALNIILANIWIISASFKE